MIEKVKKTEEKTSRGTDHQDETKKEKRRGIGYNIDYKPAFLSDERLLIFIDSFGTGLTDYPSTEWTC